MKCRAHFCRFFLALNTCSFLAIGPIAGKWDCHKIGFLSISLVTHALCNVHVWSFLGLSPRQYEFLSCSSFYIATSRTWGGWDGARLSHASIGTTAYLSNAWRTAAQWRGRGSGRLQLELLATTGRDKPNVPCGSPGPWTKARPK